jgi:xyloglucan:xyloglucosyl transferase
VCHDMYRYNGTVFPECDADDSERHDFHRWGESKRVSPSSRGYKQPRADKAAAVDVAVAAPGRPDTWPVIGTLRVD